MEEIKLTLPQKQIDKLIQNPYACSGFVYIRHGAKNYIVKKILEKECEVLCVEADND